MKKLVLLLSIFLISCNEEGLVQNPPQKTVVDNTSNQLAFVAVECSAIDNSWSIDASYISGGASGIGGIPAINAPEFIRIDQVDYLENEELIGILEINNRVYFLPHRIMDKHEVLNFEGTTYTFCPLTGTSVSFLSPEALLVSGTLLNSNLIMIDSEFESYWSQMLGIGIKGSSSCNELTADHTFETTYGTAKSLYPDALVLSPNTGFDKNYSNLPLSSLQNATANPLFPVEPYEEKFSNFERTLAVPAGNGALIATFDSFEECDRILFGEIDGNELFIIGCKEANYLTSFHLITNNSNSITKPIQQVKIGLYADANGNQFDLLGNIKAGPLTGEKLVSTQSYIGYWFAVGSMYDRFLFMDENAF